LVLFLILKRSLRLLTGLHGGHMKKIVFFICFMLVFGIACSSLSTTTPIPVVETATSVTIVTATPAVTSSANEVPLFEENITTLATTNDFSVAVPFPLLSQVEGNNIVVADKEDHFFIIFSTDPNEEQDSIEELLDLYFGALEKRGIVSSRNPSYEFKLNDMSGIRVDFSGTVQDVPMEGSAVAVPFKDNFVFIGFGLSRTELDADLWKNEGLPNFDKLTNSVAFFDKNVECPISVDETYGYTPENPIQVGGDNFNGPSRERAYLDHLLDSNGNTVTYNRNGSIMVDSVILDVYDVSTSSENVTLYLDEYNYSALQAPINFTCQGAFPLSAP
jgi:hypothetical protein